MSATETLTRIPEHLEFSRKTCAAYSYFFRDEEGDGPIETVVSLANRAAPSIQALSETETILDLCSGPGRFWTVYNGLALQPKSRVVTLDFAEIRKPQLAARQHLPLQQYTHIEGDGGNLPIADGSLAVVVNNLGLDQILPKERAISELARVLRPGGRAFINLNTSRLMLPPDLEDRLAKTTKEIMRKEKKRATVSPKLRFERDALLCKRNFRRQGSFFDASVDGESETIQQQIEDLFVSSGFDSAVVRLNSNPRGKQWWEVDLQKGGI